MRKLILRTLVTILLFLTSYTPAVADLASVPNSTPRYPHRDLYQTDLYSGSATYSYPIKVPEGTNGLAPNISLTYNSASVRGAETYTGVGWELDRDYIEQDTNFTPGNVNDDKFKLRFKGAYYDLVYVVSEDSYHTKIESNLNIKNTTSGEANDSNQYWIVKTKDGTKFRFGQSTNSELICNTRSYAYRWNLDLVEDVHGNKIFYTYSESNGASYLSKIEYNTEKARVIDFVYDTHPNQRTTYPKGCKIKEDLRLKEIQVKADANLVNVHSLSYTSASNSGQLLNSITEKGSTASAAMPPTTFTYKPHTSSWQTQQVNWINNASIGDTGTDKPHIGVYDVNGDGLPDIVDGRNTWRILFNLKDSWSTSFEQWVDLPGAGVELSRSDTQLIDVNGDNLPDIVRSERHGDWCAWKVYKNTGTGWNSQPDYWINNNVIQGLELPRGDTQLSDVNGDGLPDIVRTTYESDHNDKWKVYFNTGTSWNTNPDVWLSSNNQFDAHLDQPFIKLADVNGDGLPDIVKTTYSGTNVTWTVWKNTGDSWTTASETWLNNANVDAHFQQDDVELSDVNNDGLLDIVKGYHSGTLNSWKVLLNNGVSWSTQWDTWVDNSTMDADVTIGRVQLNDVTGDGLTDLIKSDESSGLYTWKVWKNNGYAPNLLSTVNTPQGGTISFDYKASTQYDNKGADTIHDLPFSMWVVEKMTTNNGMTSAHATNEITNYSYQGGLYDWQDREFRGFAVVDENIASGTAKKKYVFNQDDTQKGLLSEVQHRSAANEPFAETENTWSVATTSGVTTVRLSSEKNYTYDDTESNPKITQTDFQYDSYGNITKQSEKGDTSISTDDRFINNEYVYNTTLWIVDRVKNTYREASDDSTKVSETWFYYDDNTGLSDTPTKGNLTKKVQWLEGGTNPDTIYTYDSYGNQTSVTDDNNHTTTTAFDTATHTYPISVTNAKNHVTTVSYDLGTGNILSKTDPNGFTTSFEYDLLGRITKEIMPYDSSNYPTTSYTYSFDGTAPESVLISKREVSSASGTLNFYTFIDGFERKIQTRADAEDTSKQIVTDTFYDPNGELNKETAPYISTASTTYETPDNSAKYTEITYDSLARVINVRNTAGKNKAIAYDHWKETIIDENFNIKRMYKNAFGKIIKVDEVKDGLSYSTTYSYTPHDDLSGISDASSNLSSFTYDSLQRKISQTDPDMGTWEYEYDGVGNVIEQTDNRDITATKSYDELNRLTLVNYPTDVDITYTYDGNSKKGTLTSVVDKAGTVNYEYDNRLRKTQEQRTINGITKTTQFSYDAANRTTTQTNPDGEVITYAFNAQGEVDSVTGASAIINDIDYNSLGKVTEKEFANGLTTNYTYNTNDFRLNRIQTSTLQDLNYTYDEVGNIKTIFDDVTDKTKFYGYDELDRLTSASESAGLAYEYEYDPIGNLTKYTNAGKETEYEYGNGDLRPHALVGEALGEHTPQLATGYAAEYFNNNNLSGTPTVTRTDTNINFDWGGGSPDASISSDNYSARWTKTIDFEEGSYVFSTTTDDGVRLYIDNQLVIDKWVGQASTTYSTAQTLTEGNHTIKMEYFEGGGGAVAKFTYLKLTDDFTGEYFSNQTLSGNPTVVRNDKSINFDWDTASPAANIPFDNFSVRWNKIANFSAGTYQFTIRGDDGIRLYVDEQLLIDGWVDQSATSYTATKAMSSGNHRIRVEYYDSSWGANAQFTYAKVAEPFTGEYFNNQNLSGTPVVTRTDPAIDFEWGDDSPHASISANQFSTRWTKTQNFIAGDYEFTITGDDGIRLFIDDEQVINGWFDQGSVSYSTTRTLTEGNHTIRVEYYEAWGGALAKFSINKVDTNVALNKTTNASSIENNDSNLASSKAVDGNSSTRWSSSASDPQWLAVDLGSRKTINRVKIDWHSSYGSEFKIQISENGTDWNTVKDIYWTNGGIDDVTGFYATGRYIRLYGVQRATSGGYSVYEFEVFSATHPQLPTPSANLVITYDSNGNMTSNGIYCYQYNEANKMDKVSRCANNQTIAEYVYDYNGNRMVKRNFSGGTLADTVYSWSDSYETKVVVGGVTENTAYYWVGGQLVAKKNPDGSKVYFHNDHLGSNSLTTNQWGSNLETTSYDPWGEVLANGNYSKFLYTGQEKDSETGLTYMNARYYSSDIRRFTQPDPIIQNIYDPQALNRYSYVRNNPLKYTDPSGNCFGEKGLFNRICGFVSNLFSKSSPKPNSTSNPPKNVPNTQINLPNNNKNGNITQTNVGPDPRFEYAYNNGHVAQSVSVNIGGVSPSLGRKINKSGEAPTGGLSYGPGFPISFAQSYSNKPIKQNSFEPSASVSHPSGWQTDPIDVLSKISKPWEWDFDESDSCCGADVGVQYTGSMMPWVQVNSLPIEEIYNSSFENINKVQIKL